jgi:hypothetical protein
MSMIGSTAAQSVAGMANAERVATREVDKGKSDAQRVKGRRKQDEVELSGGAEAAEAVRDIKDPTQEESKGEREGKAGRSTPKPGPGKRLDVSG